MYIFEFLCSNIHMLPFKDLPSFVSPKAAAKDSFERRTAIKDCQCKLFLGLSSKTAKLTAQLKAVIQDWLQRLSSKPIKVTLPSQTAPPTNFASQNPQQSGQNIF